MPALYKSSRQRKRSTAQLLSRNEYLFAAMSYRHIAP